MGINMGGGFMNGKPMPPLSAYKNALKQLHAKYGRIPKVRGQTGKFSSKVRILGKRRYRLDPGHPNASDVREKGIHFNYEDYTNGKANTGRAIEDVFPVEGGEGIMAEDIGAEGFIGTTGGAEAAGGAAAEGLGAADVIEIILGALLL